MDAREARQTVVGFMLACLLSLLALLIASACQPAEQARPRVEPEVEPTQEMELVVLQNDNFIDVMDMQTIGYIKLENLTKITVRRVTDMDACLVFYVLGHGVATSVVSVTETMVNSYGKLDNCNR